MIEEKKESSLSQERRILHLGERVRLVGRSEVELSQLSIFQMLIRDMFPYKKLCFNFANFKTVV